MNDGRIQDELKLLQTLRQALNSYPWSTRNVHFAIPSQTVMVRFLKMPDVNVKELRKIVDFEIKNNIHLPFDDPHYDFVKLGPKEAARKSKKTDAQAFQQQWEAAAAKEPASTNPFASSGEGSEDIPTNMCDIMLVAASMELLQQYVRIFEELGLRISSFEIKAFSLNRLQHLTKIVPSYELSLLVDVGSTNCDLTIVLDGVIQITRNVPISFMAQQTQSTDALDRMFADFLPQTVSYDSSFNDMVGEMERLMNFYRYTLNHREAEFHKVVVTGDIPMLDELIAYMSSRMNPRIVAAAWSNLEIERGQQAWDLSAYAVPLGLCLRRGR